MGNGSSSIDNQRNIGVRKWERGDRGTEEWRMVFLSSTDRVISPIHDIPLVAASGETVHMVVEIPRGKQAKLEMATTERGNPIKQDIKNGELRYVSYPYPFNYGALPQTWEDPDHIDPDTGAKGDGDPIDAVEIGEKTHKVGDIIECKVLGIWGMIDDGETDWKVLLLDANDPKAAMINTPEDVMREYPGVIDYAFYFLQNYKVPTGKPQNEFAFGGRLQSPDKAVQVINETNEQWRMAYEGRNNVGADKLWLPDRQFSRKL